MTDRTSERPLIPTVRLGFGRRAADPAAAKIRPDGEKRYSRLLGWGVVLALFGLWELSTAVGWVPTYELPRLTSVFVAWYELIFNGPGLTDVLGTLGRALGGFAIAAAVGGILRLIMGAWRLADALLEPLVELLRPVPSTAIVPLAILFFGIGSELKVFIAFLGAVFPILINTYAGARSVSTTLRHTAATFHLSAAQRLFRIVLPSALPSIFVGLKLGLTVALIVTVVTEMIAGNSGMGYRILFSQQMLQMPRLFAGIFTLAVVGYVLNFAFHQIERRVLFWSDRIRNTGNA